jgi:hypothetical protein
MSLIKPRLFYADAAPRAVAVASSPRGHSVGGAGFGVRAIASLRPATKHKGMFI